MTNDLHKYPRTRHVEGSGLQTGDDLAIAPWQELDGRHLVVEEKMDGANCGISFSRAGQLRLQCRGHFLTGGPGERQFDLLKGWAASHTAGLWNVLGDRYTLYGEWCYAKHSVFYTDLPHYLMEFDILDTADGSFLSTPRRAELLREAPFVVSVRVIHAGPLPSLAALQALVGPSPFIGSGHREILAEAARQAGLDPQRVLAETDPNGLMEGLYIKAEDGGVVTDRFKYVRRGFLQAVLDSGSHWANRPLLPNRLSPEARLW